MGQLDFKVTDRFSRNINSRRCGYHDSKHSIKLDRLEWTKFYQKFRKKQIFKIRFGRIILWDGK